MRRILLGMSAIIVAAIAGGSIYQQIAQRDDLIEHPPFGEMIDVGGFRIHLSCVGSGEPTVAVEAGGGDYSISWRAIQREVSRDTRICIYDRAGTGWSDYDRVRPNSPRVVRNLRAALEGAGVEGPFVLVGESIGGIFVREFARRFSDDVVGMVLVDSSHEQQYAYLPEELDVASRWASDRQLRMLRLCSLVAPMGIWRAMGMAERLAGPGMPPKERAIRVAAMNRTHYCSATRQAIIASWEDADQMEGPQSLGSLPLVVLTAGRKAPYPGVSVEAMQRWYEATRRLQSELAALSTNSTHRVVDDAGHFIHLDRPDAVQAAIREIVRQVR